MGAEYNGSKNMEVHILTSTTGEYSLGQLGSLASFKDSGTSYHLTQATPMALSPSARSKWNCPLT